MKDSPSHAVHVFRAAGCGLYSQSPPPSSAAKEIFLLLPGAGGNAHTPLLIQLENELAKKNIWCGRVNFPYQEKGKRAPDPFVKIVAALQEMLRAWLKENSQAGPLVLVGKSMGGRVAAAADWTGWPVTRVVCLGYPLHSLKKPDQLRDTPLLEQPLPLTLIQGTRDNLCNLEKLKAVLSRRAFATTLQVVEGGDHSLVPKGKKEAPLATMLEWILG